VRLLAQTEMHLLSPLRCAGGAKPRPQRAQGLGRTDRRAKEAVTYRETGEAGRQPFNRWRGR